MTHYFQFVFLVLLMTQNCTVYCCVSDICLCTVLVLTLYNITDSLIAISTLHNLKSKNPLVNSIEKLNTRFKPSLLFKGHKRIMGNETVNTATHSALFSSTPDDASPSPVVNTTIKYIILNHN